jgi:hypothetical protein
MLSPLCGHYEFMLKTLNLKSVNILTPHQIYSFLCLKIICSLFLNKNQSLHLFENEVIIRIFFGIIYSEFKKAHKTSIALTSRKNIAIFMRCNLYKLLWC